MGAQSDSNLFSGVLASSISAGFWNNPTTLPANNIGQNKNDNHTIFLIFLKVA
jgi:hypothetical protein